MFQTISTTVGYLMPNPVYIYNENNSYVANSESTEVSHNRSSGLHWPKEPFEETYVDSLLAI